MEPFTMQNSSGEEPGQDDIYVFPMSFAQQRLWFLAQLEPDSAAYNIPAAVQLRGPIQAEMLERSLNAIVARHEVLRTTFDLVDGQPAQIVSAYGKMSLELIDLHDPDAEQQAQEVQRQTAAATGHCFVLEQGPLLHAVLVRLAPDEHILLLTLHHIIADGWSMGILIRELGAEYSAMLAGRASSLPALPIQYADFTAWQHEWLSGAVRTEQLAYWLTRLEGAPALLELPTDRPRPPVQSLRGAHHPFVVPLHLTSGVKRLAQSAGATLFMTVAAAYKVLLARYSNQSDILVGFPIANRNRQDIEPLIGFFVNTLVLRSNLGGNPRFVDFLAQVRQRTLEAYQHQDLPFEVIVDALHLPRNLSHSPLFQTMLGWEVQPIGRFASPDMQITPLPITTNSAKFDLTLLMEEGDGGLTGVWEYNTDLFDAATVARMATHFLTLLEGIVAEPEQRIAQLPLLTADERHLLLEEWNRTTVATPQGCVHELFAEQVARTPDAVAVVFEDQQLTYAELNDRANQLAHYLRGRGVGPDVLVGVCCERTPELLVALLGILKAGGAYVPLDPAYPAERLSFMLKDAGITLLLTQRRLHTTRLAALRGLADIHVLELDHGWDLVAGADTDHPAIPVTGDHLAYVIYTSGSTGLPKGVQITHRGLTNYLTWAVEEYRVAEGQGALVHSSISFDATITSLYTPLLVGKPVVLIPEQEEIETLSRVLQGAHHYSLVKITPAHLEALSYLLPEEAAAGGAQAYIIGGEALFERHIAFWRQHAPGVRMVNEYGPTETVVGCCVYTVPAGQLVGGAVPIGRPIANTQLYVLDAERQPVPLGVAGELYIGGAGVARGYLNRPELTAERFIPHPFGAGRLYKTGDMVRYLADGNLVYLGRLDSQVKIRGFRIELGEIEALLTQYPLVRAATVTVREERGEKRLVAYLVRTPLLSDEQTPHPREEDPLGRCYRDFLRRQLPEYMIPSAFVVLDALPLSPNGKVDHKALPAPTTTDVGLRSHPSTASALTPTEATLTAIWQQVLHLPHIGPDDNFFTIGGDSILSIQVVARARRLGIQITPRQLFQHQTIRQLSAVATAITQPAVIQEEITGSLPLTPIQHWFLAQGWPDVHHFNQAVMLEVAANLNVLHLQAALTDLERHHDALRLRFVQVEGVWRQENAPTTTGLDLAVFDLSLLTPEQRSARLAEEADRAQESLNLERGPLLRAAYFNYGDQAAGRLLVVIHHMAVDGVSWRILLEDWQLAYQQRLRGEAVQLPAKTTAFRDWARWLAIEGVEQVRREHAYWQQVVSRCDSPLPVDHSIGLMVNTVASADEVVCTLDAETTALLLHTAPAAYRTQVNDLLLAALVHAVSGWSGQKRVVLELEGHGREVLEDDAAATTLDLSRTVGWFTSLFPVVLEVEADDEGGMIRSVKEQLCRIPNHGMGYGILRYVGALEGLVPVAPISLSFNYLGQFDAAITDTENPLRPGFAQEGSGQPHSPTGLLSHLLDVNALVIHGELQVAWRFSQHTHQHQTIETLAAAYLAALRQLIDHCRTTAGGYTPSDFTARSLSQAEVDRLHGQAIDDIYELSPMQEGMLFEALYAPESGVYVTQLCFTLERTLNVAAFRQSWQELVSHHPMLRTCFLWERDPTPLQLVQHEVTLLWAEEQWADGGDAAAALSAWLAADRQRGFALDHAPLMRCALLRTAGDAVSFIWTSHHLIGDGWSLPLLMQELFVRYQAACTGRAAEWPSPRPYRDYLLWLRRQDRQRAEIFWREQLHSFTAPTPLTVDRPAPTRGTRHDHYPTQRHVLSPELTRAVSRLAQQQQVTLNTVIQGAWAILLSRYSGNQEIIFGATISGRPATLPGVERMVGLFINTVPIAVTVPPSERLGPWLQRLQQIQAAAQEHGYLTLSDIQRGSDIPSGIPLFEHILVFENYPVDSAQLEAGAALVRDMASYEQTNYPLTIAVVPPGSGDEDRLTFAFSYDSRRLDAITITRMAGHLQTLIEGMVTDPTATLATLSMLTATEQQQLLEEWNATAADYPQDRCIHELFEEQVARTPDAVAVVFEDQQLTYAELNARANQLALHLIGLGIGPDVLVGLCVERSREMIIGLLGILKAGGAYVPLDPSYPAERLAFMLDDAAVPVLLTQSHLLNTLPPTAAQVVCLDRDWPLLTSYPIPDEKNHSIGYRLSAIGYCNPSRAVQPHHLVYAIFTSGSTGKPKVTGVYHRGLVNLVSWYITQFGLNADDRTLIASSPSFDLTQKNLFAPLIVGGQLVLSAAPLYEYTVMTNLIQQHRVTWINCTPSAFYPYLAPDAPPDIAHAAFAKLESLRYVILGGEPIHMDRLAPWLTSPACHATVVNTYGPTECTDVVSAYRIIPTRPSIPIGTPVANTCLYVLDDLLRPVPIGVTGELYIGGIQVGAGYLNRPELTAERFIPNPFGSGRLYKTGDLVRYLADGNLEYLGRSDQQVKIRGFRIELGEIESVLHDHPAVRECVVLAREDSPGDLRLVAYVVTSATGAELRSHLQKHLPEYMVPSIFVQIDTLPLTPSGKVDRKALPVPDRSVLVQERLAVAPRSMTEVNLAHIWQAVLGVPQISIHDNFFELGGHSLLAIRVMAQVQQHFGQHLPLASLFENPTIAQLALRLHNTGTVADWSPLVPIQPHGSRSPFFCIHGGGGNVLHYDTLARHLGNEQPFYALQAVGLDGRTPPLTSVEDMAACYVVAIQTVQPHGPYFLGGHSLGGHIAYAMAQLLRSAGHEVALVVVMDTFAPGGKAAGITDGWDDTMWMLEMAHMIEQFLGITLHLSYASLSVMTMGERFTFVNERLQECGAVPPGSGSELLHGLYQVFKANNQANYAPTSVIPVPLALLRGSDSTDTAVRADLRTEPTWGWSAYADGPVDLHVVPGDHSGMLIAPHVHILAECLGECLARREVVRSVPQTSS